MILAVALRCLLLLGTALAPVLAPAAASAPGRQDMGVLRQAARQHVEALAKATYPEAGVTTVIGAIDPRLQLPACPDPLFVLAPGSPLWGPGNLQASCRAPAWSLYLSYRNSLRGPALVATRALPAGAVPGPADLAESIIDYAGDPGRYPRDTSSLAGSSLARPLARHAPLTIDLVRRQPVVRAGQRVRIVATGDGFQVSQTGIAQGQAAAGDSVRLKTPSGRLVQGIVQPDGSVMVRP